jgi:hypothetical protein
MSILPIKKSTIVYGSNDYGHTMHAENKKLGAKMRIAARKLNIKPHRCGVSKAHSQVLPSPADLEGHVGGDNRTYLLVRWLVVLSSVYFLRSWLRLCVPAGLFSRDAARVPQAWVPFALGLFFVLCR